MYTNMCVGVIASDWLYSYSNRYETTQNRE